ncbi:MAG: potassium channel family protein [Bacteroidia bacterium]
MIPISVGVLGYMLIENAPFLDALFMTITTISTVGYGEIFPLSNTGRIFTIFLIISNLGVFAYAISLIGRFLFEGQFFEQLKLRRMKKRITGLKDHVIVCGFGRNGQAACETLKKNNIPFVIIESKKELIEHYLDEVEAPFYLNEDATHDETLLDAGIKNARGLITTLPADADNVYVVLTARELNANLTIISRATSNSSCNKLKRAGANNVIMPDRIGGAHMASLIVLPDVKEFIDIISGQVGADVLLEEFSVQKLRSSLKGNTIKELGIRQLTNANVIGLKKSDGNYEVNPDMNKNLLDSDKLIVLGTNEQMTKLHSLFS